MSMCKLANLDSVFTFRKYIDTCIFSNSNDKKKTVDSHLKPYIMSIAPPAPSLHHQFQTKSKHKLM